MKKTIYNIDDAKLKVGDVVRSNEPDIKGVFIITGIKVSKNAGGHTYYSYQLNESEWVSGGNLERFTDPNTVNEIIDFLINHVNDYVVIDEYMGNSRAICKADLFDEIRERFN